MREYCVSMMTIESGEHVIHRNDSDCSLVPPEKDRIELGLLSGDDEAIRQAGLYFDNIDGCPECMLENNTSSDANAINAAGAALITVSNM